METNEKGCVYFFRHIGLTPVKIGYSTHESPIGRFEQFKTYAPYGSEILGFIRTYEAKELESILHERFSAYRLGGEWFEITKEQCDSVISFYSSIEDVKELNEFQIAWAKYLYDKTSFETKKDNNVFFLIFDEFFKTKIISQYIYNSDIVDYVNKKMRSEYHIKSIKKQLKEYCIFKKYTLNEKTISNKRCFTIINT